MTTLDVVVVNWNAGEQLTACLDSLRRTRCEQFRFGRVVVVDNASTDASATGLEPDSLPLVVLRNRVNRGFAAACNQGAAGSTADLLLFLNPDAEVYPGTLDAALERLGTPAHARTAVAGVLLEEEGGAPARSSTRALKPAHAVVATLGLDRLFPGRFRTHFMREWDHLDTRPVDHVIGAFYLVRRSVFEVVGGFDERFFVYLEDLDLSTRIRAAGHDVWYFADVRAFHRGGGTSDQAKAARLFYSLRSRILYGHKHFGRATGVVLAALTLVVEPLTRIVLLSVRRDRAGLAETLGGFRRLWAQAGSLMAGRARTDA